MQQDERGNLPTADNFLVQGVNLNNVSGSANPGTQYKLVFQPGKKHLVRFINTSTQVSLNDIPHRVEIVIHACADILPGFARQPLHDGSSDRLRPDRSLRYGYRRHCNWTAIHGHHRSEPGECDVLAQDLPTNFMQWRQCKRWHRYCQRLRPLRTSTRQPAHVDFIDQSNNCDDEFLDLIEPFVLVDLDATSFNSSSTAMNVSEPFKYNLTSDDQVFRYEYPSGQAQAYAN